VGGPGRVREKQRKKKRERSKYIIFIKSVSQAGDSEFGKLWILLWQVGGNFFKIADGNYWVHLVTTIYEGRWGGFLGGG